MAKIDKKPLPIPRVAGRRKVGPGLRLRRGPGLAVQPGELSARCSSPSRAPRRGDGRLLVLLSDPFRGRKPNGSYSNMSDAYFSNTCLDFPVSTDVADYKALAPTFQKVAPHFRAVGLQRPALCVLVGAAPRTPAPASGAGAPPIVVVGSTGDPATPYEWAKALAEQLESAVLITRKGEGHTGYLFSNCVKKALDAYLLELTVPKQDSSATLRSTRRRATDTDLQNGRMSRSERARPFSALERWAGRPIGWWLVAGWAMAEALVFPIVPDVLVCLLALAAPRRAVVLFLAVVVGALAGSYVLYAIAVARPDVATAMVLAVPGRPPGDAG